MLKQRNLIIRPENRAQAEAEIRKLEFFGWERVQDTPTPDGAVVVSFLRDDEEKAKQAEAERSFRNAKLASKFASSASERITELSGSDIKSKKGPGTAFLVFSIIFAVLALVVLVWQGLFSLLYNIGLDGFTFGGGWAFFNYPSFSTAVVEIPLQLFFGAMFLSFAVFFAVLYINRKLMKFNADIDSEDYANFAVLESIYYDSVVTDAAAEAAKIYRE